MNRASESGIRPAPTLGVRVPRHMRGSLEMGGTGEYLSGLISATKAAGIKKTTDAVTNHVTARTTGVLNHIPPLNDAISGVRLATHLNEHAQHGSAGDYKEGLIAASIAARTRGQLAQ